MDGLDVLELHEKQISAGTVPRLSLSNEGFSF